MVDSHVQYRLGNVDAFQLADGWVDKNSPCDIIIAFVLDVSICTVLTSSLLFRSAIYIRSCGPADWYVSIQVQAHATGAHVQGSEASHLLPIQHRSCRQGTWSGYGLLIILYYVR